MYSIRKLIRWLILGRMTWDIVIMCLLYNCWIRRTNNTINLVRDSNVHRYAIAIAICCLWRQFIWIRVCVLSFSFHLAFYRFIHFVERKTPHLKIKQTNDMKWFAKPTREFMRSADRWWLSSHTLLLLLLLHYMIKILWFSAINHFNAKKSLLIANCTLSNSNASCMCLYESRFFDVLFFISFISSVPFGRSLMC